MAKIIIGIHGLGNKPPKDVLYIWWKKSIREGFYTIDRPNVLFRFELVYWADLLYPEPLDPEIKDPEHPKYIDEMYLPYCYQPLKEPSGRIKKKVMTYLERQLDNLFLNKDMSLNFSSITDSIIHHYFRDLETYYSGNPHSEGVPNHTARELIQKRLVDTLRRHRHKEILLIGHSMGSIIAYDVLSRNIKGVSIDTFVTLGSPLGLPVIVSRIFAEQHKEHPLSKKVYTPEAVKRKWLNFTDVEDRVSLDRTLSDDYESNSRGVRAEDISVFNNYVLNGKRNPHKIYGYLRTPELAERLDEFYYRRRFGFVRRLLRWLNNWIYKHIV
jgi:hypothetical protein